MHDDDEECDNDDNAENVDILKASIQQTYMLAKITFSREFALWSITDPMGYVDDVIVALGKKNTNMSHLYRAGQATTNTLLQQYKVQCVYPFPAMI